MARAAATGAIDFSKAALLDRDWWLKCRLVLAELEERSEIDLLRLSFDQLMTMAAIIPPDQQQSADRNWKQGIARITAIARKLFPWIKFNTDSTMQAAASEWARRYGDPRDPAVKEKIRKTIERWKSKSKLKQRKKK